MKSVMVVLAALTAACSNQSEWPIIDVENACARAIWVSVNGDFLPSRAPQPTRPDPYLEPGETSYHEELTFNGGWVSVVTTKGKITDIQRGFSFELASLDSSIDENGREHRIVVIDGAMCPPVDGWPDPYE